VSSSDTTEQLAKLLVVDDEDFVRDALTRYLSGRGYSVGEAANGEEALEALSAACGFVRPHVARRPHAGNERD